MFLGKPLQLRDVEIEAAAGGGSNVSARAVAKAWFLMSTTAGSPSLISSFNVASISAISTGFFNINFSASFSSANYTWAMGIAHKPGVIVAIPTWGVTQAVTGGVFPLNVLNSSFASANPDGVNIGGMFFGD